MTSHYISPDALSLVLGGLTDANRLVCQVCLTTGLRVGDVLAFRTAQIRRTNRPVIHESKTGKTRRIYLRVGLRREMLRNAGTVWIFEGRLDPTKHRTRQAVWKDIRRVVDFYSLGNGISPHSFRKTYAANLYEHKLPLKDIQKRLNHDHLSVTFLYALSKEFGFEG